MEKTVFQLNSVVPMAALLVISIVVPGGCTKGGTAFTGSSTRHIPKTVEAGGEEVVDQNSNPNGENVVGAPSYSSFAANTDILSSLAKRDIWIVTSQGEVTRFSKRGESHLVEEIEFTKTGNWTLQGNPSGHRTFVTEAGLVVGKTGGMLFHIGDNTPANTAVASIWKASDASSASRLCVNSFKIGGQAYVGGAYTTNANKRKFVRIPLDPMGQVLRVDQAEVFDAGTDTDSWGYSCFTDQARQQFWSMFGGKIHGFDLKTMSPLPVSAAPNVNHSSTLLEADLSSRRSYALAGDSFGNLLNAKGWYTFAHDPISNYIIGAKSGKITLTKAQCFSTNNNCQANDHYSFEVSAFSSRAFGPLSSFNDGYVVGLAYNQVFLIKLKDPLDASKGIDVKKVGEVNGHAYMYTDFTGATLYAATEEKTIDLLMAPGFVQGKPVKDLTMTWSAESGTAEPWRGLVLQMRCYSKGESKSAYQVVNPVPAAGERITMPVAGCNNAVFNQIDVRISPSEGEMGGFSKTRSIGVSGNQ